MRKPLITISFFIVQVGNIYSQLAYYNEYVPEEVKSYSMSACIETSDGYIFCGGNSKGSNLGTEGLVLKTDKAGELKWVKRATESHEVYYSALTDINDGFVVAGFNNGIGVKARRQKITKYSYIGEKIWEKEYGDTSHVLKDNYVKEIIKVSDGFIVCSSGFGGATSTDAQLNKFSFDGELQWTKMYGNDQGVITNDIILNATLVSDGLLFIMQSFFPQPGTAEHLVKTDFDGNEIWRKDMTGYTSVNLPQDPIFEYKPKAVAAYGGNHCVVALSGENYDVYSNPYKIVLVELDGNGNEVWSNVYLDNFKLYINNVRTNTSGEIFVGGISNDDVALLDMFVCKFDQQKNLQWYKQYGASQSNEFETSLILTSDGGTLSLGYHQRLPTAIKPLGYNLVVAKTDCRGETEWDSQSCVFSSENNVLVFPNPTSDFLILQLPNAPEDCKANLLMYDMQGKKIYEEKGRKNIFAIDVSSFAESVYAYQLYIDGKLYGRGKFVKR